MSRRMVFVVSLLLAVLIVLPLEGFSQDKFQEEQPEEPIGDVRDDDLKLIAQEEGSYITPEGQRVGQTTKVYVDPGSDATSLADLGVSSIAELRRQESAARSATTSSQGDATVAAYCRTIIDFGSPYRVRYRSTGYVKAFVRVTRGHGCTRRLHYSHVIQEHQLNWAWRKRGAFYVYPGYVKAQTLRTSICKNNKRENWRHMQNNPGYDRRDRALYCNDTPS